MPCRLVAFDVSFRLRLPFVSDNNNIERGILEPIFANHICSDSKAGVGVAGSGGVARVGRLGWVGECDGNSWQLEGCRVWVGSAELVLGISLRARTIYWCNSCGAVKLPNHNQYVPPEPI